MEYVRQMNGVVAQHFHMEVIVIVPTYRYEDQFSILLFCTVL